MNKEDIEKKIEKIEWEVGYHKKNFEKLGRELKFWKDALKRV